jgi:hypothetical protein
MHGETVKFNTHAVCFGNSIEYRAEGQRETLASKSGGGFL